jgi:hypothetical protein
MTLKHHVDDPREGFEFFGCNFVNKSNQFDFDVFDAQKRA